MDFWANLEIDLVTIGFRLLGVFVVLIIGRWLAGFTRKWLLRSLQKTDLTESFNVLIVTLTYYTILLLTVLIALAILGVPTSALVGATTIIVVVLAITLQTSLGNLAATVNFLLFKPFVVGDIIETAGVLGIVKEIQLFSTVIVAPNHKTHILPNSKIQGAGLANYSKIGTIRVDLAFDISYESDVDKAKEVIAGILTADEHVLKEPPPQVFVQKLDDSSIVIAAWPFVQIADFLDFQTVIAERVKNGFEEANIVIPYPQQDVHLVSQ